MRCRRGALGGVALLVALTSTETAFAEAEISVFAGYHRFSPHNPLGRSGSVGASTALTNAPTLGARIAYLANPRFGGELELAITPTETKDGTGMNLPSARFQGVYNLLTGKVRPSLLLGVAALASSPADPLLYESELRPAALTGSSVHVDIGDWWGLRADARMFALAGTEGHTFAFDSEVTFGIYGRFPAPPPPEERGRGAQIPDEDHDGVGDALDKCPSVEGPVRNSGCPADEDRDKDGIIDRDDKCPDDPGTAALGGCKDSDGDGIIDPKDRCPNEAGIAVNKGCPDKDRDGDGIVDRLDKCADQPETVNGFQDEDGCPDEAPKPAAKPAIPNLDRIDFDRAASTILPASLRVLDAAARILNEHPEVISVEVVGHTDDTGAPAANLQLSQARAEAVRTYLIQRGVAADRLTAVGRGSEEPLDRAPTEAARRRNRRVEFRMKTAPVAP
ncbi:MAG TPA: OmpA family protein [Labilithrix sp.]|nr:OmpA family protein [Labilithrix sp.]